MEMPGHATIRTLKDFFNREESNLEVSVKGLGTEGLYRTAENLDVLYETALRSLNLKPSEEVIIGGFFLLAHLKFRVAIGLHLRCHIFEAQSQAREAIEAAAYAYVIYSVPNAWEAWLNRKKDKPRFDKIFTKDARFPLTHLHLSKLRDRHAFLSEVVVHGNVDTFAERLKFSARWQSSTADSFGILRRGRNTIHALVHLPLRLISWHTAGFS